MANKKDVSTSGMTATGFLWRFLAALILVLVTYNPSDVSAFHWIKTALGPEAQFGPLHLLLLGVLVAGWAVYWTATWRSLGAFGFVVAGVILGAMIWGLYRIGLLESASTTVVTWIVLITLAAILAIGMSWSHIWRRMTGQFNVEDVDD
jgi:hypothetical protein